MARIRYRISTAYFFSQKLLLYILNKGAKDESNPCHGYCVIKCAFLIWGAEGGISLSPDPAILWTIPVAHIYSYMLRIKYQELRGLQ